MKIAVLGYGKEGKSTYDFLKKQGYKNIDILDKSLDENYLDNLEKYNLIFKSPGISIYDERVVKVLDKITSQADYFFENYKGKIILITGSKGKSTTSTLIYKFLKQAGKDVKLVGNIGNPIFDEIDFNKQPDYVVFEISSYMLDSAKKVWTTYGILTNLYKVHLSWHRKFENYRKAKFKIFKTGQLFSVRNELESELSNYKNIVYFGDGTDYYFDNKFLYGKKYKINKDSVKISGNHNYLNIVSAFPILEKENISQKDIEAVLSEFGGLEHRQEFVAKIDGVEYYNDSISTIPESVLQVLQRFDNLGTLILGGQKSGFDYNELIDAINSSNVENIVLLPDSFDEYLDKFEKSVYQAKNLVDAVNFAKNNTKSGKVCVLSPGAPSLNMFKNFEERGRMFKELLKN